ncbi:MAG: ISNCY family transposase [Candidatus Levybacteria bacterium]|nr:ISNCY family transposase [Candidatus Levybacteria bacterium]
MAEGRLSPAEQERLAILTAAIEGTITNGQAAKQLRLSVRQVQRAKVAIKRDGSAAVVHKLKGKQSNHHIDQSTKEKALKAIKEQYADFKPAFATEKLQDTHGIAISSQTTRRWMTEAGLWKIRGREKATYRSWRPRKEYFGELEQFDGSYHLWFEKRFVDKDGTPIEVCLLAAIDDATGIITKAQFAANEGVVAVFTFWQAYIQETGKPLSIYLDKFSTYKINHKAAVDNHELMTQFQRAMGSLSILLITAHSPEAKGRVERLFGTLQDRLCKEMRLTNITTPEDGNRFLTEVFLPKFNKQFAVVPAKEGDIHRKLLAEEERQVSHIFSIHETRRINLDFTIQFKNQWYQLTEIQPTTVRPLLRVTVETWPDQTIHIILKGHELQYILLPKKPKKQRIKQPVILTTHTLNYKPPQNHPWRTRFKPASEG